MADKKTITLTKGLIKLPDGTYIAPYTDTKGAFEIGDIGQSSFVDESEGLRRRLNGSIIHINESTQPFLDKLKIIKQHYPKLFCTEERWQHISKANFLGQVGKFVINETGELQKFAYDYEYAGYLYNIDEKVYGFLNNTNYIKFNKNLPWATATSLEIVVKINVTQLPVCNVIIGNKGDTATGGGIVLRTSNATRLRLWGTTNASSWTTSDFDTGIDLVLGEQYIKMTWDSSTTTYQIHSSIDGETWVSGNPLTSAAFSSNDSWLFSTGSTGAYYLRGNADLKGCYIKVDNEYWWQGAYKHTETEEPYIRLPKILVSAGDISYEGMENINLNGRVLIYSQSPQPETGYQWCNLYSDGWVEQGSTYDITATKTFKIPFKDTNYMVLANKIQATNDYAYINYHNKTTTQVTFYGCYSGGQSQGYYMNWYAFGWADMSLPNVRGLKENQECHYPYFIQVAQGQYTTKSIRNDWTISEPYTIFEPKYSYNQLNNASWLFSNQQWNTKAIYPFAYEALCVELNDTIQTGEKVQLPSGGYYTKHLQTLVYDPSRFTLVGTPKISKKGFAHTLNSTNYVKFNVGNAMQQAESYTLKFRMQYINDTVLLSTHNQDTINNSNGWLIRLYDNKIYTSFAMVEGIWAHESTSSEMDFVEGDYYYVKLSYTNSYGYKLEVSKDDIKYESAWEYADVNRFSPVSNEFYFGYDYENVNAVGTPIDLKTIHFRYKDGIEHLISGAYYVPMVYDINDINKLDINYERKFKVDRLNETFMLPTEVDRELNNGEMLYYYIGDVLQNTSLIDIGRMTEALARKIDTDKFDRAYYFQKCPVVTLATNASTTYEFTLKGKGRPIHINCNGNMNLTSASGWSRVYLYRNNVEISEQTNVGAANSENLPFALSYLDTTVAYGETVTYKIVITQHSGTAIYGENGIFDGINILAYEI